MKNLVGTSILGVIFLLGCSGPSTVPAVPRTSQNKPVFGNVEPSGDNKDSQNPNSRQNKLDVGFFQDDHFACLRVDVGRLVSSERLSEVPWDGLEDFLAANVGKSNSELAKINCVWMLLDRSPLGDMSSMTESVSPAIFVIEYKEAFNESELAELGRDQAEDEVSLGRPTRLDDLRIAIGDSKLVNKLKSSGGMQTELADKFGGLELDAEINGVLLVSPIRSLLTTISNMASGITGQTSPLTAISDSTRYLDLRFSISDDQTLLASIYLEDKEIAGELAKMLNEGLTSDGGVGNPMMGMGMGMGGMGGQASVESLIPSESEDAIKEVSDEIKERGLFSVSNNDEIVTIKLRRPEKMDELVAALIVDAKKQSQMAVRLANTKKIAQALKEYENKYGRLPSSVAIAKAEDGIPNQFSWRVALLPFLGEQELYDQFDFDKPWDSESNLEVANSMPDVFRFEIGQDTNQSRIHLAQGEKCVYTKDRTAPKLADIGDKKIFTAIAFEASESSATLWTQPTTIDIDDLEPSSLGQANENGVIIINAAFKPRIVKRNVESISNVFSANGDETMTRRDFISSPLLGR